MSLTLSILHKPQEIWRGLSRWMADWMPKGLYWRSILIVVVPMVILQAAVALFFMERHWQRVTARLSAAVTRDIAGLIELAKAFPDPNDIEVLQRIAAERLNLDVELLPQGPLPAAQPKPFFSMLDRTLSEEIRSQIQKPFWIDTVGRSSFIEIRIKVENGVWRILTKRSAAYASNSHIFMLYMIGTSLILVGVALAFLRNQIRPILRLADAAEEFGKGRDYDYRPTGAREVRQAGYAFVAMKRRVERAIEQRTAMLNGVSHDLRTILTRFKLSLALLGEGAEFEAVQKDVDEMSRMLEAYLAFARGDLGEPSARIDMRALLEDLKADAERHGHTTDIAVTGDPAITVRPDAFKRCLFNLLSNAQRHADRIAIDATRDGNFVTINVDDDGPGIPDEQREDVFRPFYRLDEARNQDEGGSGLGLAIARDIARSHGGDIQLGQSPLGGLRASVRVPI
jgi:two-component system osmolarity sensor histidine kinase EnvZ